MDLDYTTNIEPMHMSNLILPLDSSKFTTGLIQTLYSEEQLTQDEYLVLDYIGTMAQAKNGMVSMSFQGLKRLTEIHQAKLTKALNRLKQKNLVTKNSEGYSLSQEGINLYDRLIAKLTYPSPQDNRLPPSIYSHVVYGNLQGPLIDEMQRKILIDSLVGRWFGDYRYTTKTKFQNSVEISWISTEGKEALALLIGPENNMRITHTSSNPIENSIQVLVNRLSQVIEDLIDAPIAFTSHNIYENSVKLAVEPQKSRLKYAG